MNERSQEKSENRKALPKFALTMLVSMLAGGVFGFVIGFSRVFGLDTAALARWLDGAVQAATPWGIPVTTVVTMGGSFLLYRSAARGYAAWDGGDEDETSESIEMSLSWVLLLSAVQLLIDLFFMAALATRLQEGSLWVVGLFLLSCGLVVFAQQKAVDLEKRMNPEKHGSVYDTRFQKEWLDSCDASRGRVCLGLWLILTMLGMVFEMSILPVFVLLLVWGTMQVTYTLACIRMSKHPGTL